MKRAVLLDTSVASTNIGDQIIMEAVREQLDRPLKDVLVASVASHDTMGAKGRAMVQAADLVVVAPATADLLARAASGRADDLLTNVLLTATCPVLMAPAMHTEMWLHAATQANVATLRERGVVVLDPAAGDHRVDDLAVHG